MSVKVASALIATLGFAAVADAQSLTVAGYTLVRERPISRIVSEYEYRATLTNPGASALARVSGRVVALLPTTTVVDATLTFDNVPAGGSQASTDTFIVRRPRILPLTPSQFVWTLSVNGSFAIGGYTLVRERRVNALVSEFDYEAILSNQGPAAIAGATATVVSAVSTTTVIEGALSFGSVGADQSRRSSDTFTLRRLRSLPLNSAILGWTIVPTSQTSNQPPIAAIVPLQGQVFVGASVVLDGTSSTDPDGNPLTYSWALLSRPAGSQATLSATTSTVLFTPDVAGSYTVQLTVSDGSLSNSTTLTFSTANRAPSAVIAPVGPAFVTQAVTLDGSGSTDPDGDGLTYSWLVVSRPAGSVAAPANANTAVTTFAPDRPGVYELGLVVDDGTLGDDASISFTTSNSPPVANAGSAQSVAVGTMITLDGSGSTDVDGDPLTFEWSIASRPAASASELSDPSAVMPTFNVDAPGTYLFELVVRDPSNAASAPSVVAVSTVNSPPVANAGADQTVAGGAVVQLNGTRSADVDGDPLSYLWEFVQVPSGSTGTLAGANTVSPTFVADRRGLFVVRLTVSDPSGAMTSDEVSITTSNSAPVANAGTDQSVALTTVVQLDGSGSTDVDGDTVAYSWSFTTTPAGSLATLTGDTTPSPSFVVDIAGAYVAQLIVSDGQGGSDIDTVTISTANTRPVANAGLDQAVVAGQTVTLNGLASSDAEGDSLTYSWALTTLPAGSMAGLASPGSAQPTFVADVPGIFVAQLFVSDGTLTSEPDTVTITTGNTTPVADAGHDPLRVVLGATVDLSGEASTDADGNPLTYAWALLARPVSSMAELDSLTGATTSFTPDVGGDYVVQLIVNDGFANSVPDTVTVRVNRPPIADAGADRTVAVGARVTLSGMASTDADLDPITFSWSLAGPAGSAASLDSTISGTPSFVPDVAGVFTATLTVNDGFNSSTPDAVLLTAEVTAGLGLAPATQTVSTFMTTPVTVTVAPAAGPGDLQVTLSSDASGIASVPSSVTIPAGQSAVAFDATTGDTAGTATITATAPLATSASASITVSLRSLGLALEAATVGVNRTILGTVNLAEPAPAAGASVTIVSDAPGVATVSPAVVVVPAGGVSGGFSVFGAGLGSANVLATATGFTGASAPIASAITLSLTPTPFEIERAETKTATLSLSAPAPQGGLTITLSSDDPGRASVPASIAVAAGQSVADVVVTGVLEGMTTIRATGAGLVAAALAVTVVPPSAARIESSPAKGEGSVAVTRETILRFSRAITNPELITPATLFAQFGGRMLQSRIHIAPDRKTVTLFYLQTLPASARVRVTFNTDGLVDELGVLLDGDRNGQPGGLAVIDFDTLTLTTLSGTAVVGRVFASELGNGGVNTPLAGVVISVDGLETTLRTTTDAMGNFRLEPAPVGEFFVHIDGRTATNGVPVGAYYPVVGKKWESTAGHATTIPDIFLPLIAPGTLQPVSQTEDTVITFPASVLAQYPQLTGVQITVPADSLYSDSGARGGMVGIAPVPPDRIPSPLPPGLNLPLVITVQTDGATNFDRPVPVCFPNLPDPTTGQPLAAGSKSALWSFNHDIGDWEIVGPMTVSADGSTACSDSSIGIRQPGWHGTQPGSQISGVLTGADCPISANALTSQAASTASASCTTTQAGKILKGFTTFLESIYNALKALLDTLAITLPQAKAVKAVAFLEGARKGTDLAICAENSTSCDAERLALGLVHNEKVTPQLDLIEEFHRVFQKSKDLKTQLESQPDLPFVTGSQSASRMFDELGQFGDVALGRSRRARQLANDIIGSDQSASARLTLSVSIEQQAPLTGSQLREAASEYSTLLADLATSIPTIVDAFQQLLGQLTQDAQQFSDGVSLVGDRVFVQLLARDIVIRFESGVGLARLSVPPESLIRVRTFRARNGAVGHWSGISSSNGTATAVGSVAEGLFEPEIDSDGDGLEDDVEDIVGTDATNGDTDFDGISDGAEVQEGSNPLDGLAVQTGVVATADTAGVAVDVAARNDVVFVANSGNGVSVLNVVAGLSPVIVGQVDTPGDAHAVAFEDTLVAVADGPAGLAVVDISDPPAARIVRQLGPSILGGGAQAVTVAGGTAYVGLDTNRVAAVDLASGTVLETVDLPSGSGALQDLAIERDTLYVLTVGQGHIQLHAIPLESPLQVSGSVASPGSQGVGNRRLRVFAGAGIAYATHASGYNTFSLADPRHPTLITAGSTSQFGWKQIVANGSGLGFAAVGPNRTDDGPHNVSLYDVSDPAQTDRFITEFETPGLAAAVSIYNGIGYVADSEAGLQVVNYLAFDRSGVPPTIALESNFSLSPTGGTAEEGHVMRLTANVDDDVQVRNVEFFVNGASVARDGNFPFEHRFVTPLLGAAASFTVKACAFDTGGNRTCTADISVTLVEDGTPPSVRVVTPPNTSRHQQNTLSSLSATFGETIDVATLTAAAFQLFSAGPDGLPGTTDDVVVPGGNVSYNAQSATAVLSFLGPLPIGSYRAVVGGTVSDLSGNPMGSDFAWTFSVRGDKRWISDASGLWSAPSNWSDNEVPQPGDFVVIDRPGANPTITYDVGALSLSRLQTEEHVVVANGPLSIDAATAWNGGLTLSGVLQGSAAMSASTFSLEGGTLEGSGELVVTGATTLLGGRLSGRTLRLGTTTASDLQGFFSEVRFTNSAAIVNPAGSVWTVTTSNEFALGLFDTNGTVTNLGTIVKLGTGVLRAGVGFSNSGVFDLRGGTVLMTGGGSSSGSFLGQAGSRISWDRTDYVFESTSVVNTEGVVDVGAGLSVRGAFSALELTVAGFGNAAFSGAPASIGTLTVSTGSASFATATPTGLGVVNLLSGSVSAGSNLTVGTLNWTAGGFGFSAPATISVTSATAFSNAASFGATIFGEGGVLRLGPQTTFADGSQLVMGGGTSLVNPLNGQVQLLGTLAVSWNVGGSLNPTTFANDGGMAKHGAGTATLGNGIALTNDGTIDLLTGTLALAGGASGSGNFSGAADTTLSFGGATSLDSTSRVETAGAVELGGQTTIGGFFSAGSVVFSGSGTTTFSGSIGGFGSSVTIASGAVNFDGPTPFSIPALTLSGGQLGGTATVIAPSLSWQDGAIRGTGALEITGTTTVFAGGSFGRVLSERTLRLGTLTLWQDSAPFVETGATIVNPIGGTLRFETDAVIGSGFGVGSNVVNQGTLEFAGPARLLTISGNFLNEGTLVHRLGGVAVGLFDRIAFGTPATLGGTLDVRTIDGFVPSSGDAFQVLTYPSASGQFVMIEGNGEIYTPTYGPSTFILTKP